MDLTQASLNGMQQEWQRERAQSQMTLGKLIDVLERLPEDMMIDGLCEPHSYRGYYCDLAFEKHDKRKASEVLADVKKCMGETFIGYKGGEFDMGRQTPVWVASYSCCGEKILSVSDSGDVITEPDD